MRECTAARKQDFLTDLMSGLGAAEDQSSVYSIGYEGTNHILSLTLIKQVEHSMYENVRMM